VSWQATKYVQEHSQAKGSVRLVLLALAERAGRPKSQHAWECWPGVETIALAAGVSARTAQRSLKALEGKGPRALAQPEIAVVPHGAPVKGKPQYRPNLFRILVHESTSIGADSAPPVVAFGASSGDNLSPPVVTNGASSGDKPRGLVVTPGASSGDKWGAPVVTNCASREPVTCDDAETPASIRPKHPSREPSVHPSSEPELPKGVPTRTTEDAKVRQEEDFREEFLGALAECRYKNADNKTTIIRPDLWKRRVRENAATNEADPIGSFIAKNPEIRDPVKLADYYVNGWPERVWKPLQMFKTEEEREAFYREHTQGKVEL